MAEVQKPLRGSDGRLGDVALEMFKGARHYNQACSPQELAIACFQDAMGFMEIERKVLAGELDVFAADANPLDDGYAPNLKKTHPINLMSKEWGNIEKVREQLKWLEARPEAKSNEEMHWELQEVNQARALFPAVVKRADEMLAAKAK